MKVGDILIVGLIVVVLVILSPIIAILMVVAWIINRAEDHRFRKYLADHEGVNFFCYTSRKTSVDYVKENIVPFLPPDTNVIYLWDGKPLTNLGEEFPFVHLLVGEMKQAKGGFPYAAKIRDGKLVSISINNQLYSAIKRSADADSINRNIHKFLES